MQNTNVLEFERSSGLLMRDDFAGYILGFERLNGFELEYITKCIALEYEKIRDNRLSYQQGKKPVQDAEKADPVNLIEQEIRQAYINAKKYLAMRVYEEKAMRLGSGGQR